MTRLQDKAQGLTKQFVGEMIGDGKLTEEGKRQEQRARKDDEDRAGREDSRSGKPPRKD
jgi:uncharacterized protein YjbJ (UPF0337 family)